MTKRNIHLFCIDPQNDFCDIPADALPKKARIGEVAQDLMYGPTLPVTGAHNDMQRLGEMIRKGIRGITDITVTLDSHHFIGIERVTFWRDAQGQTVAPYTMVTASDVRAGKYLPANLAAVPRVLAYLDSLETSPENFRLIVWPVHCEIGTWGCAIHDDVRSAMNQWEQAHFNVVRKVTKGSCPWSEHYSIFKAEVPDPKDPTTQLNVQLINTLNQSDLILVPGEAGSHCIKASLTHLIENMDPAVLHKIVLLDDCISPVTGFEQSWSDFKAKIKAMGVQISTSVDMLPELLANA